MKKIPFDLTINCDVDGWWPQTVARKGNKAFFFSCVSALTHDQMNSCIFHSSAAAAYKIIVLRRELEEEVPALVTSKMPLTSGS